MSTQYVIVKYADQQYDRRGVFKHGATLNDSAHQETYTGRKTGCKPFYDNKAEADAQCDRMREFNPHGYWAVKEVFSVSDMFEQIERLETVEAAANAIATHFTAQENVRGESYSEHIVDPFTSQVIENCVMIPVGLLKQLQQAVTRFD